MRNFKSNQSILTFTLLIILYVMVLVFFSIEGFPSSKLSGTWRPYLADEPVGEDGFYMLTVAWNLMDKGGFFYNHELQTTGIQPLSTVLYALVAKIVRLFGGDKWDLIRMVIVLGGITHVLFAYILKKLAYVLTKNRFTSHVAFLLALFNLAIFRLHTYGLETGFYLLLLSYLVYYHISADKVNYIKLGLIAGFCGLARIDFGVIFFLYLSYLTFVSGKVRIKEALTTGLTAFLVVSPWLLYVFSITGSFLPSSGGAQSAIVSVDAFFLRFKSMFAAILDHAVPVIYTNHNGFMAFVALGFFLFLLLLFRSVKLIYEENHLKEIFKKPEIKAFCFALVSLPILYFTFFWAWHFYIRYTAPLSIIATLVFAVLLSSVVEHYFLKLKYKKAALGVGFSGFFILFAGISLHAGNIANPHLVTCHYLENNTKSSDKVGCFQSGVIGYFFENVYNLDGKLDHESLGVLLQGNIDSYIDEKDIDIVIDWNKNLNQINKAYEKEQFSERIKIYSGSSLIIRKSNSDYSLMMNSAKIANKRLTVGQ